MSARPALRTLRQCGFTLVELMISMLLGAVILAAVLNMYLGSTRSAYFSEGLQTMQENGRYGVMILQKGLRLAGYSPDAELDPIVISASGNEQITVQMRRPYDCNGNPTADTDGIAVDTYARDAVNNTLVCTGNQVGAAPMDIVEGVDSFRVLYGIDENDDGVPERYVGHSPALIPRQVVSVRFALLVNSGKEIRRVKEPSTHVVLDSAISINDRFARYVFSNTVYLRNRS